MHGAGGGAPRENRNALKHGGYTAEAIETRRMIAALMDRPENSSEGSRTRSVSLV
jgi:glucans biosynthesis protein